MRDSGWALWYAPYPNSSIPSCLSVSAVGVPVSTFQPCYR